LYRPGKSEPVLTGDLGEAAGLTIHDTHKSRPSSRASYLPALSMGWIVIEIILGYGGAGCNTARVAGGAGHGRKRALI
jgi:hypothetical protein